MADEVPVCDVLCEAMEYLAKLGSNLRSRSESLKEKRMSKEKLKNFHAVQKAANKVLLICQLSKKSIQNVETGIRKVLSVADASQQPATSKGRRTSEKITDRSKRVEKSSEEISSHENSREKKPIYHYFKYRSHKLKVARKIYLKHFTSVKVMAKRIPMSMLDNYPVYCNCKLYRIREKQALKENVEFEDNDVIQQKQKEDKSHFNEKSEIKDSKSMMEKESDTESDQPIIKKKDESRKENKNSFENDNLTSKNMNDTKQKESSSASSDSQNEVHTLDEDNKEPKSAQRRENSSNSIDSNKANKTDEASKKDHKQSFHKRSKYTEGSENGSSSKPCKRSRNCDSSADESTGRFKCNAKNKRTHKTRKYSIYSDSSEDENTHKLQKMSKNYGSSENESTHKSQIQLRYSITSEDNSNKKKSRHIMIVDDSSDDGTEKQKLSETNLNENISEAETNEIEHPESEKTNMTDLNNQSDGCKDTNICDLKNINSENKSLLKCVSLSKLLKPDVLQKVCLDNLKKNDKTDNITSTTSESKEKDSIRVNETRERDLISEKKFKKKHSSKKMKYEDNEAFWEDKRRVVKSFKPKQFSVYLHNLPKITVAFLQDHGLKKVTQGEFVICEMEEMNENNSDNPKPVCQNENSNQSELIDKVKSALLNDSESEKSDTEEIAQDKKHEKNSLLNESDSENEKQKECKKTTDTDKSERPKRRQKKSDRNRDTNKVKKALLNESDSESGNKKSKYETRSSSDSESKQNQEKSHKNTKQTSNCKSHSHSESDDDEKNNETNINKNVCDEEDSTEKAKSSLGESDSNKERTALPNESESDRSDSQKSKKNASNGEIDRQIVKSSLLKESDSDKNYEDGINIKDAEDKANDSENSLPDKSNSKKKMEDEYLRNEKSQDIGPKSENVKESLLKDSDSDSQKGDEKKSISQEAHSESNTHKENEIIQCNKSNSSSCDSDKEIPQEKLQEGNEVKNYNSENKKTDHEIMPSADGDEKDLAKSSLLKDSSGDSPKSTKGKSSDNKTKLLRKHMMESMHAKKMLLTYSSSSDTENEQIKSVVQDIKNNLLQALSTDEEETQKTGVQRHISSSDSDVEVVKRVKRKRKTLKRKKDVAVTSETRDDDSESSETNGKKMGRSSEKPGSSSSHSDNQHDRDIEGLTNLKTLTQPRRRPNSKSNKTESSSKKENSSKNKHIAGEEGLLEAPSSSDGMSAAESEGGDEELPSVSLPSLNGSAMAHLAKDDLLVESDSDTSKDKDKSSDDVKKDDSDSENIKSKRRKANAISSDSETGSSKRKPGEKFSDFEDSEDENSEPAKKGKRKKKVSDSDASVGSSSDGGGKKKRRRIKLINDSDASGSEDEREGKNKHGRKNIRKVMGKNQLEEATKRAAREERERLARIAERQKTYNNLEFDESGKPDEVVLDKVVLDFDPETKEPLIEVDRGLVKKLKPHQANGIKFMWDACFESVKRIKKDKGSGCILAHCMGLGKTLQVVSLTHTLLTNTDLTGVNRVLVVCPLSTVLNWVNEFRMWLKHAEADYDVDIYELSRFKQNSERAFQLSQWFTHGGVCVLGYEMFRNLSADNNKKFKKKMLRQFQESLVDPGPELVVCDEGHLLKNEKTSLSQSMNRVKTRRRIVLTGTPLQNNLKEYYCMVQFVKPNLLGKYNEYLNRFVNPITNGQYTDSTEQDIRVMKRRSHVLHKMLDGAVQRRDYSVLAPFLPPKHEYVLFITLTEVQIKLYQHYLENYSRRPLAGKSSGFLFPDFQSLQRIWTHPLVLKYNSERYEIMQQKKREREEEDSEGSLADFIDDDSTPDESSTEESMSDISDVSDDSRKKSKKKKSPKKSKDRKVTARRGTRANPIEQDEDDPDPDIVEVKNENPTEWWIPMVTDDEIEDMRNSHKLVLLFEILRQCEAIGDKVLVFSQSLYSLDLIEHFLGKVDEATQEGRIDEKLGGHVGSWSPGVDYFRLDGSTSCENRSIWCKNFNREDNPRARLFLISTRAGGLGINLVAANRVVIFDVSWNPSHDVQSIFRVYRFGQKKPCYIYRFLAMGTMEEKIYERQVTKQAISKRVIDEQQIDRHYAENDLAELYKFEPRPPAPRPVPLVPKDRFFAEMLKEHEDVIYKFHEHDSLLENKEEETLSEEERKAAWEDFENEKNKPPPAPFPSWPMHNGMGSVPMLQQQQLMYAAVASMLRKDMPNLTDDQVRNMLPLIYGANPGMFGGYDYGLMQKLNDMYKYAQPGMMNPAMMNPVMNAGGAGAPGPGGSSGLQYEPPWQRQQQQQQQMRLQQLLQHQQNPMGAKFYAGGLGSRDPVAMALQQQRAREMMLGERRPRGRPPHTARTPPATAGDIVNLDSD